MLECHEHKIDGIGAGFVVPLWRKEIVDRIELVSTDDAKAMALRLAREEDCSRARRPAPT